METNNKTNEQKTISMENNQDNVVLNLGEEQPANIFKNITTDIFDDEIKSQYGIVVGDTVEQPINTDDDVVNLNDETNKVDKDKDKNILESLLDTNKELEAEKSVDDEDSDVSDEQKAKGKGGRPLYSIIKKLVEENVLLPFEDDKPIEKYTQEEIAELIKENINYKAEASASNAIEEFVKTLPQELQLLTKYVVEGGTDIKNFLSLITKVTDVSKLELGKDDETIVRLYLENTKFGNEEDILEQIELLKSTGKLGEFAIKYKAKLDEMQNEIINNELKKQEEIKKQQQEFAKKYVANVTQALSDRKINDIVLSPTKVAELISGLTSVQYDSISGRKTNKLGYLLEEKQFKNPDLKLIAEVLWLLDNPQEYKEMLINKGKQLATSEIKRSLKTTSQKRI